MLVRNAGQLGHIDQLRDDTGDHLDRWRVEDFIVFIVLKLLPGHVGCVYYKYQLRYKTRQDL